MRYHLDTSFLVDWQREEPVIATLIEEILRGTHQVSITGVAYAEFMAAPVIPPRKRAVAATVLRLGDWLPISLDASINASRWLAPMNRERRRAFFADALIAAASLDDGATLLTGDRTAAGVFSVRTHLYTR